MTHPTYKYPAGTILMLEQGEYSDFGYAGGFVTLQEFDLRQSIEDYKEQFVAKNDWSEPDMTGFCGWIVSTQRCAPLDYQTAHIGSYGRLGLDG